MEPWLELLATVVQMAASVLLPYVLTRWDRGRLCPAALARAWNGPSWAAALVFFGPFCLP